MAHLDDLTLVSAAQLQETDELYVGRPSDPADPDRRTLLGSLAGFMGENLPDDTDFIDALLSSIIGPITTNANGSYIRLDNGLQIAWGKTDSYSADVGSGAVVRTNTQSHTLPAAFLSGEDVTIVATPRFVAGNPMGAYTWVNANGTAFSFRLYGNQSGNAHLGFLAIGRWK